MSLKGLPQYYSPCLKEEEKEKEMLIALPRCGCEPIFLLLITAYPTSHVISRIYLKSKTKTKQKQQQIKNSSNTCKIQC